MPVTNNIVLHTQIFLREEIFKCPYYISSSWGWEETLGSVGYVYGLHGGDSITGVYFSPNSLSCTH